MEKERLARLLARPDRMTDGDETWLKGIADRYPWFVPVRVLLLRRYREQGRDTLCRELQDRMLLELFDAPYYPLLYGEGGKGGCVPEARRKKDPASLIDSFLHKEVGRIVPREEKDPDPDGTDLSAPSAVLDGDTASETLARIYERQGLKKQAAEVYEKLSLKYPEKSVYFANLISRLSE